MADPRQLQKTIQQLLDAQPDDQRLRDHLEGIVRDPHFSGLTWFWGPLLYERNRAMFRNVVLNHFSDWQLTKKSWKRIKWSDHQERLEMWLKAARESRDTVLVKRLLRWKHAASNWGIDQKSWLAAMRADYESAQTPAAKAIVLDEYDDWFELDEQTALYFYSQNQASGPFLLRHLPRSFWGEEKRKIWSNLAQAARDANDDDFYFELYRRQVPVKQWHDDALQLAHEIAEPNKLCDALEKHHPSGWGLKIGKTLLQLLENRGRDVMPYVRGNLKDVLGGWYGDQSKPFIKLAEQKEWWDLWAAAIRAGRDNRPLNAAIGKLIFESKTLDDDERVARLASLAGVSREWNWSGFGFAQIHALDDKVASPLYEMYPDLIRGPFKPNVTPTWWQGYPELLASAQKADDADLVDILASRYATLARYENAFYRNKEQDKLISTAESLSEYYENIQQHDEMEFARRAANVLTRIPAFTIHGYDQLLRSNQLARLLFVRSFGAYLASPESIRDLVEGSEIHVQMLAYRILAQDDQRARQVAADTLEILIGTLLRPLHRKTRLAAFDALYNASLNDSQSASFILQRAREAVRLPDKKYPKEQLVELIAKVLYANPDLQRADERTVVFGRKEVAS